MSVQDFDFIIGNWTVAHRKLRRRLAGADEWDEFVGTVSCRKILDGAGNFEENTMPSQGCSGVALRLFDPLMKQWSIYWAGSVSGTLDPAMVGNFQNGVGTFLGDDHDGGRPVRVRFIWSRTTPTSARWEQAFSADGGATWETNWYMDFTRMVA